MTKLRTIVSAAWCGLLLIVLSGCTAGVLAPRGIIAANEKQLLTTAVLLMLIVVIPVIIMTFLIAWKYRASNSKAKYTPDWSHSNLIEVVCWGIPCAIVLALAILTWKSSHQLDPYKPLDSKTKPLVIQVIALNWKWLFIYPEQHIATVNFVQIPVQTPVEFLITSDAPMNSFQIPQLAGQIYAMAGMQTKQYIMASVPGDYRGLSTNFSGDGFSNMKFIARVSSPADYGQWVKTAQHVTQPLTMAEYNKLSLPSEKNPIVYYAPVEKDLFNTVIMKFMMPMQNFKASQPSRDKQPVHEMKHLQDLQNNTEYAQTDSESRWNKPYKPR